MPITLTPEEVQRQRELNRLANQQSMLHATTSAVPVYKDPEAMSQIPEQPFFLDTVPYLTVNAETAPAQQNIRRESRSEEKKREEIAKQRLKAAEATRIADLAEGSTAVRISRHSHVADQVVPLDRKSMKLEQSVLDKRLNSIEEKAKTDMLGVDLLELQRKNTPSQEAPAPENSAEALRLKIRWEAQKARVEAYNIAAGQLPIGSKERAEMMAKKEDAVVEAGRLKREYSVACMPAGAEKEREAATIKRHGFYDKLKHIFRKPSIYSREDAVVSIKGRNLINAGRATLGGTKAMYVFHDMNELDTQGAPQEYLFKEATNCVGMAKPEGAVVTGEASKLQHYLRGNLYIPAQCLKDSGGNVVGSIQRKLQRDPAGVDLFAWQASPTLTQLDDVTMKDLMNEHTLDWILCNFDTKGENFINQPGGHIVSFDKEASFNTLLQDGSRDMSYTFKPHSNDTIYNTMFAAYAQGRLSLNLSDNLESIRLMERMTSDQFIALFKETLDVKYDSGSADRAAAEERLRERHRNLRETYRTFYSNLIRTRLSNVTDSHETESLQQMLQNGNFVFDDEREDWMQNLSEEERTTAAQKDADAAARLLAITQADNSALFPD